MEIITKAEMVAINKNRPIRVLHIIDGLGSGGAESLLMGLYRNIDKKIYQFDFLIRKDNNIYKDIIEKLGGNVFVAPAFPGKCIDNFLYTKRFLKNNKYLIIHVHGNSLMYIYPLCIAKQIGIPCRIMHSHNTSTARKLYYPIHLINKFRIGKYANIKLACSKEAGVWMFGDKKFTIIKNGIEPEKFMFQENIRLKYRKELNISKKFVIGNVARFLPSKNHSFLLKIFIEVLKQEKEAELLLIGEGPEKDKIIHMAENFGISDHIQFMGVRHDVSCLMQAMDVFVLPSHFEGLGIVLVEAQFAGLPCFASNSIPKESKVSEQVEYISLQESPHIWAEKIIACKKRKRDLNYVNELNKEYDIKKNSKKIRGNIFRGIKEVGIMKIVHVCLSGTFNDDWGYQENILSYYNLKSGHDVTVIASNYVDVINKGKIRIEAGAYTQKNGVRVLRIGYKRQVIFLLADKLKLYEGVYSALIAEQPDIIFHHGSVGFTLEAVVRYKKFHQQCILLVDNHSDQFNCAHTLGSKFLHYGLWRFVMKRTIPYVDKYFGVLPLRCEFLNKVYGIPKEKIELMIMGVDDEKIKNINKLSVRKAVRSKYGVDMDEFLVITGGKIDIRKNIHLLMKAINDTSSKNIKLLIFGKVDTDINEIFKKNISEKIKYIGWIDSEKVYELFSASDLAAFPGTHSVLWEQACATGLPGIYKKMPGIQHIDINKNVLFVENPTVEKLKDIIENLSSDKNGIYTKTKGNAQRAAKAFWYSNIVNKMYLKK